MREKNEAVDLWPLIEAVEASLVRLRNEYGKKRGDMMGASLDLQTAVEDLEDGINRNEAQR